MILNIIFTVIIVVSCLTAALTNLMARRQIADGRRKPPEADPQAVICGCSHHKAVHNPRSGACGEKVRQGVKFTYLSDGAERMKEFQWVSCRCMQFVPESGAPAVSAPGDVTPAALAKAKGYDADYVAFLEWVNERERSKET
jgi:hypothetical protein